jgi:hypothetical protein
MKRYYEELAQFAREGFQVIVDKTYEDIDPWDCLSECFDNKEQLYKDIDEGHWDWFMLRVRVLLDGHELACEYLGGCMYADAAEVLTDGTAEDTISEALVSARREVFRLKTRLEEFA